MLDIFGPKFKLEKFSICTPCWNMVQLVDDFRTCCFEANSCAERIKSGLKAEDGWFTQDTVKRIESMHSAIRHQIERIKTEAAEEIHEPVPSNDVITIDDDSDDESDGPNVLIIDQPLDEEPTIVTPKSPREMLPETSTLVDDQEPSSESDKLEIGSIPSPEIPKLDFKIEADEPEESTSDVTTMQLIFEDASEASHQSELSTLIIKTEVELPEDGMDAAEYANQTTALEDHVEAHEATMSESLYTEISVENIKVENEEVGENIAQLVNARVSQCGRCGSTHKNRIGVIYHLKNCKDQTAVGPDVMYTCQICWASYRSKTNFRAHINQHIDYKPYKCRLKCNKHFFGLKGRMKHEAKCNAFICCAVCDRTFSEKESLFAHIKAVHGKITFTCEICDMRFPSRGPLRRHCSNMHTEREGDFPCRRCKKHVSKTAHEANLHVKQCRMSFTFDCVLCGARLRSASLLKNHMVANHEEPKYECKVCGKKYKKKLTAMQHQIAHEDGKGKIPCSICHKKFSSPNNLKRHMTLHGPVCPYPCTSCGQRFSSKQAMETHVETVCLKVGDKIQCQYCPKNFVMLSRLERHIVKNHSKHLSTAVLDDQTQEI
uniref:Putative c2h2-type zn-finger protein n=1 Tax=Culex tarsalis TaxID=7177 RepID=A0A1Q3EYA9_CULTA